jgi:type IV pilus assembly protein PilM
VDYILLSGGSASLPGLPLQVTEQTSFPCKLINPFEGMKVGSAVNRRRLDAEATSYLVAAGLAMRRFFQ